jgi:hypothetical protein
MTKLTRSGLVYSVMNANATLPMDEVLALIVAADTASGLPGKACDLKRAKAYYTHAVKNGIANGVGATATVRTPKAKATKAAAKPKLIKVPKPKVQGDKPKITDKTVEEIADIRAKNLARLKAVGRKYMKGQYAEPEAPGVKDFDPDEARAYVEAVTNDLDSFKAPSFLDMDQVKALV